MIPTHQENPMNATLRLCAGLIICLCCLGAQEDKKLSEGIWIGVTVENASYSMGRISIADWTALCELFEAKMCLHQLESPRHKRLRFR
jgi:hypothetical protein